MVVSEPCVPGRLAQPPVSQSVLKETTAIVTATGPLPEIPASDAGAASARLGAHLSGGVKGGLDHARRISLGAGTAEGATGGPIQLWSRNPSAWKSSVHTDRDIGVFRDGCDALALAPVFIHGIYLMNFCSANDELWEKSISALAEQLTTGARLGARAVVIHPGSGGEQELEAALDRCALAVSMALQQTEHVNNRPLVALEICAGAGKTVGRSFGELGALMQRLDGRPEVAVCLDTAHMWGSGYDIATETGLQETLEALTAAFPLERVVCLHANDSKVALGSCKDRHENIGEGAIGEEAFGRMLRHEAFRRLPWVLEVPGLDGMGPDKANLDVLRRLAAG